MNIYWEEEDYTGDDKKPDFKKANDKVDLTIDLSEVIANGNTGSFVVASEVPTYVGGYDITGGNSGAHSIVFNYTKKPNWFHRTCCRFFLGWKWNDKKV